MKEFVDKYADRIHGVLSCFDRMLFRGYLPIMSGWAMAEFLNGLDLKFSSLNCAIVSSFALEVGNWWWFRVKRRGFGNRRCDAPAVAAAVE